MAAVKLIFSTDYEVFGNGSGSVKHCMLRPTESMARTLEKYGAKMTVFFDVCEYWAFEREFEKGTLKQDWAGQIRSQLQDLMKRGHDVQLHFHPQWLDYQYDGVIWTLNHDLWRISSLKYEDEVHPERGLNALFHRGKATLEDLLRPVKPTYRCHIFRAGAWSIQPESDVLRAMRENGFDIDSSVAPGLQFKDDYTQYDFRNSPTLGMWKLTDQLLKAESEGDILEVPIFTAKLPLWRRMQFVYIKVQRRIAMKPEGCSGSSMTAAKKSKWSKVKEILAHSTKMLTFGDATSSEEMIYFLSLAMKLVNRESLSTLPVVAISHPKTFANEAELDRFLAWVAANKSQIEFSNYEKILDEK